MTQWISVDERLPENAKSVLAYFTHGENGVLGHQCIVVLDQSGGGWYEVDEGYHINAPTHWMPLPEGPLRK